MATKYQRITGVYEDTIKAVSKTPAAWTAFLRSACRNYRCRFDEQILIYAQRPDATAVLETEKWNKQFGRWVNRGATGIAVFDDEHNGEYRLKHYFDISDTHGSRFARPVPLWAMQSEYEGEVIESLENSFGELEDKPTLAAAILSAAKNAVEDNISDYLHDLDYARQGSFLEELDELNLDVEYRTAVQNSVAYMLLSRCGFDASVYLNHEDFHCVTDFNTRETVNALGIAASDISEMCLREIAATVRDLQKRDKNKNRTVAKVKNTRHNESNRPNKERSFDGDRSIDLSDGGRLPHPQSDRAGGKAGSPWEIRVTPKEIPEAQQKSSVSESIDGGDVKRASHGDRADGQRVYGTADSTDGGGTGSDRADESVRANEVGGDDEQHPAFGGGNDTERPDLRIKPLPTQAEQLSLLGEAEDMAKAESSAFSISQQIIDEVLTSGGNEGNSALRIVSYFKKDHPTADNAEFLRNEYRTGGKGFIFGGKHVSVWFDNSGLYIAIGDTTQTDSTMLVTWEQAAKRIRELLDMGRYMPQSKLDKADGLEIQALAAELWYFQRDLEDGVSLPFLDEGWFKGGFADSTVRITEIIAKPENQQSIIDGLREFAAEYEQNNELLRFRHSSQHLYKALTGLEDLQCEPLVLGNW